MQPWTETQRQLKSWIFFSNTERRTTDHSRRRQILYYSKHLWRWEQFRCLRLQLEPYKSKIRLRWGWWDWWLVLVLKTDVWFWEEAVPCFWLVNSKLRPQHEDIKTGPQPREHYIKFIKLDLCRFNNIDGGICRLKTCMPEWSPWYICVNT